MIFAPRDEDEDVIEDLRPLIFKITPSAPAKKPAPPKKRPGLRLAVDNTNSGTVAATG